MGASISNNLLIFGRVGLWSRIPDCGWELDLFDVLLLFGSVFLVEMYRLWFEHASASRKMTCKGFGMEFQYEMQTDNKCKAICMSWCIVLCTNGQVAPTIQITIKWDFVQRMGIGLKLNPHSVGSNVHCHTWIHASKQSPVIKRSALSKIFLRTPGWVPWYATCHFSVTFCASAFAGILKKKTSLWNSQYFSAPTPKVRCKWPW